MNRAVEGSGENHYFQVGKSQKENGEEILIVTFEDVAGIDEAKQESYKKL